jgi:apolipoprotein N-acyltransferase
MNSYGGINIPLSVLILFLFALYLSLYMAIFTVSCAYLEKRTSVPAYLLAAPVWVVLEYARGAVMTGFPGPSSATRNTRSFLSSSGFHNGDIFHLLPGSGGDGIVFSLWTRKKVVPRMTMAVAVLIASSLAYGFVRLQDRDAEPFRAAIVQGNVGQDVKMGRPLQDDDRQQVLPAVSFGLAQNSDLIIWPETAMPFIIERDIHAYKYVRAVPAMLRSRLLFGTVGLGRKASF